MSDLKLEDGYDPTSEKNIRQVESILGTRLPEDYRYFLLHNNGGRPPMEKCVFYIAKHRKRFIARTTPETIVLMFYGIYDGEVSQFKEELTYEILDCKFRLEDRIPKQLLPIACDPFGNDICLAISGRRRGKVYFWDHELELGVPSWFNVFFVAKSFDNFIDILRPYEDVP